MCLVYPEFLVKSVYSKWITVYIDSHIVCRTSVTIKFIFYIGSLTIV